MGTSNWQNIPYCVEVMMKIAPQRVLDVGMGFGRWGILTREFCDVWFGRVGKSSWSVDVTGLEGYQPNVTDYHRSFYDRVIVGDAAEFLQNTREQFDLVIFGDVLEHFERAQAEKLLDICRGRSTYVMINIPLGPNWPQEASYGNEYERHRSTWQESDFTHRPEYIRHELFSDYVGRPFGTFVLSSADPAGLRGGLFSRNGHGAGHPQAADPAAELLLARATTCRQQLEFITNSGTWKMLAAVKRSAPYRLYARLRYGPGWQRPYDEIAGRALRALPDAAQPAAPPTEPGAAQYDEELEECLEGLRTSEVRPVLAFAPPAWLGVSSSTRSLFGTSAFPLPPFSCGRQVEQTIEVLLPLRPEAVVLSGFAQGWWELARQLRLNAPKVQVACIWHGNLTHMLEPEASTRFYELVDAHRRGYVDRIGCVKSGMAEVLRRMDVRSVFMRNYVPLPGAQPARVRARADGERWRLLIVASDNYWRKNMYAQVAAAAQVPNLDVRVVPGGPEVERFAESIKLPRVDCSGRLLPPEEVCELMRERDLVLAVSLSECCPMTPLESMAVGTPCLIGPSSHLFGDDYLDRMLVVSRPDDSGCIARAIEQALAHRQEIIDAYWRWAGEYQRLAQASVEQLIHG